MGDETVWCDACRKHVVISDGSECGLEPSSRDYDDYIASTALLPCSNAVVLAGRARQKALKQGTSASDA
jgi:hypothetical protein